MTGGNDRKASRALQTRFRTRRFAQVDSLLRAALSQMDEISVLDAGGMAEYWNLLAAYLRPRVQIHVLNLAGKIPSHVVSAGPDLRITHVAGDACAMPQYADGQFDLVHSNSVIEHVGSYAAMTHFADEMRRVGRAYCVQTPNFWFPIDPHVAVPFFHWLPDPARALAFSKWRVGFARRTSYAGALVRRDATHMLTRRMMRHLFPDAEHRTERIALLPKSLIAVRT